MVTIAYKKGARWLLAALTVLSLVVTVSPIPVASAQTREGPVGHVDIDLVLSGTYDEAAMLRLDAIAPLSVEMVEGAIEVLARGWSDMRPAEQEQFRRFFDPAQTGEIDDRFVRDVLHNYRLIRQRFGRRIRVEFEAKSRPCELMRLYYTDFIEVHVCPYFMTDARTRRLARDLVHEVTHSALLALDRPYYSPGSSAYRQLTPRGPWTARIPVVGPLFRAIARGDTLYHPDAYAWFAATVTEGESRTTVSRDEASGPGVPVVEVNGGPLTSPGYRSHSRLDRATGPSMSGGLAAVTTLQATRPPAAVERALIPGEAPKVPEARLLPQVEMGGVWRRSAPAKPHLISRLLPGRRPRGLGGLGSTVDIGGGVCGACANSADLPNSAAGVMMAAGNQPGEVPPSQGLHEKTRRHASLSHHLVCVWAVHFDDIHVEFGVPCDHRGVESTAVGAGGDYPGSGRFPL